MKRPLSDMNGYVCVYRHSIPCRRDWLRTESAAASNPRLRRFLDVYDDQSCFYDWGDDPSFFAASEMLGDVRKARWGVCHLDVRRSLKAGTHPRTGSLLASKPSCFRSRPPHATFVRGITRCHIDT